MIVTGWVVETRSGTLIGPFETAQDAALWLLQDDSAIGGDDADADGKIRPIIEGYVGEDDEDEDEDE